jgi:hypothetical protein
MPEKAPGMAYKEIDISTDRAAMLKYNIQATPTIVILDPKGSVSDTMVGLPSRKRLSSALEKAASL